MKAFFRTYLWSLDFGVAILLSTLLLIFMPIEIKGSSAVGFYNIGITVLSIIFSLFFAALAIIMSSTDNDFIMFLEEEKHFTGLMATFKVVLIALFVSLAYSIVLATTTDFYVKSHESKGPVHSKITFVVFVFMFTYSLIATAQSVLDTIRFTSRRTEFLVSRKNNPTQP